MKLWKLKIFFSRKLFIIECTSSTKGTRREKCEQRTSASAPSTVLEPASFCWNLWFVNINRRPWSRLHWSRPLQCIRRSPKHIKAASVAYVFITGSNQSWAKHSNILKIQNSKYYMYLKFIDKYVICVLFKVPRRSQWYVNYRLTGRIPGPENDQFFKFLRK